MVLRGVNPIINDEIMDFNAIEKIIHYLFCVELKIDPSERGIIIIEQPLTVLSQKEKICEILFKCFKIPAVLFLDAGLADALSTGKTSALVIRFVANSTYIIPIWKSVPISSAIKKIPIGIADMIDYLQRLLQSKGHKFISSSEREILRDIQEKFCFVSLDPSKESGTQTHMLPDGTKLDLENEAFQVYEAFFNPRVLEKDPEPLDFEIFDTLMNLDEFIREDLAKNIILSGTKILGMQARLSIELNKLVTFPIKITQSKMCSSWIGASIMGTIKEFQYPSEYWITIREYYDVGPKIVHSKPLPRLNH